MGLPGVGKDHCATKLSQMLSCVHIDADMFLTIYDKQALIAETFTQKNRLNKLSRLCAEINLQLEINTDVTVADSLPDEVSRQFVQNNLNDNVRFILVQSPKLLHRTRLSNRSNHFFSEDMLPGYVKKHWEPVRIPHSVLINDTSVESKLLDRLKLQVVEDI